MLFCEKVAPFLVAPTPPPSKKINTKMNFRWLIYLYNRSRGWTEKRSYRKAGFHNFNYKRAVIRFERSDEWQMIREAMKTDSWDKGGVTDDFLMKTLKDVLEAPLCEVSAGEKRHWWELAMNMKHSDGLVRHIPSALPLALNPANRPKAETDNTEIAVFEEVKIPGEE